MSDQPVSEREATIRTAVVTYFPMFIATLSLGDVLHDTVIGFRWNRNTVEKPLHEFARAGRIGDQHDRAALPAEAGKRVAGLERCRHAIVDDPPDVAQYGVIVGGES